MTATTDLANGAAVLSEIYEDLRAGGFYPAMHRLCERLGGLRSEMTPSEWSEFCRVTMAQHPLCDLLQEGPIMGQWRRSPPGARGDSLALDLVCGRTVVAANATGVGRLLYGWEYSLPFSQALRSRRALMARELNGLIEEHPHAAVLSVGHSHLVEANVPQARWRGEYTEAKDGAARFDFIYALDYFDTLDDAGARHAIPGLVAMLRPNGRLLVANLAAEVSEAAYLEACLDYWPSFRSEEEMAEISTLVPERQISSQCIFRDEEGSTVFLEIQRPAERE